MTRWAHQGAQGNPAPARLTDPTKYCHRDQCRAFNAYGPRAFEPSWAWSEDAQALDVYGLRRQPDLRDKQAEAGSQSRRP